VPARLDLTARAASQHPVAESSISWGGALPPLPPSARDAVRRASGLTLDVDAAAPDPLARPAFSALYARTRAEQVVLAFSSRTNLVLAGTSIAVVGDGPLADELSATLTRIGARVVRFSDSPLVRLRAHLAGLAAHRLSEIDRAAGLHYLLATGEHAPLTPPAGPVRVDAAPSGSSFLDAAPAAAALRAGVERDPAGVRTVAVPAVFPADAGGSALDARILDALGALSVLRAAGVDDGDAALAELVLS
jgi:hypothetical protein